MVQTLPNSTASKASIVVSLGIVWVVWGSTYLAIKFAIETIPPFFMIGSRFLVAGALMYGWLRLVRRVPGPSPAQWKDAAILGGLMLGLGTGLVAWAEQTVPSGIAALIITVSPLLMVLLEWLWKGGVRPSLMVVVGLLLGLAGVTILAQPGETAGQQLDPLGVLAILAATVTWSIGSIHARDADQPENPFMSTSMQMFAGGALLFVFSLASGESEAFEWRAVSAVSAMGWGYLLLVGSFIAYSAYVWLIRNATAATISTYAYVNPVVAVFLGWALGGETLDTRAMLATVVLVAAVVLVLGDRNRRRREHTARVSN